MGVGVAGVAEVHGIRRLLANLPDNHLFVKLDFSNAFNSVRRDTLLATVAEKMSELYRFVYDSLKSSTYLTYGDDIVISAEGSQQLNSLTS